MRPPELAAAMKDALDVVEHEVRVGLHPVDIGPDDEWPDREFVGPGEWELLVWGCPLKVVDGVATGSWRCGPRTRLTRRVRFAS